MVANMIANQKRGVLKSSKSYAADKKKSKKSQNKTGSKTGAKSDADKDIGRDIGRTRKPKPKKEEKIVLPESADEEEVSDEDTENALTLPSAETDAKLQKMVEKSQKVEKEKDADETEPKSAFLSISTPAADGEVPKVPSYSHQKNRGVIYISHVPHGFYEKQMREFFGQFGVVTNLRLGRSKRTGRSCGYAFVEFKYKEVATVVSETMNNYLMFDKILKCSLVPQDRVSPAIFRNKIRAHKAPGKTARVAAKKLHNSVKEDSTVAKRQVRQVKKVNKSLKKLKEAGIEYSFKIAEMAA